MATSTTSVNPNIRFIFVTGGVVSGIGKGTTVSSLGALLRARGVDVVAVKIDPYLNVDAGTMSPEEHGEVFVLRDGSEVDLDLGCYERFLGCSLSSKHSITTGSIMQELTRLEREGHYLGKTVQIVPHATDLIKSRILDAAASGGAASGGAASGGATTAPRVCIVELGGTVGDIESMMFLTALRDLQCELGPSRVSVVHVSLIPVVGGEQKTKPTQHSTALLRQSGLMPDALVCRSETALRPETRRKLRTHCRVRNVICMADLKSLYEVPEALRTQRVDTAIGASLGLWPASSPPPIRNAWWQGVAAHQLRPSREGVRVLVVGKYKQGDAYLSLRRALIHAAFHQNADVDVAWVNTDDVTTGLLNAMCGVDAIVVPGGFGTRGFEAKLQAIRYARKNRVPFLGLCLGFQAAVIEYARDKFDPAATSEEFVDGEPDEHCVVVSMPETDKTKMGGTMRLGDHGTRILQGSLASWVYGGRETVVERHRHRYEVSPGAVGRLEKAGLVFSGSDSGTGRRKEILEINDHPYFIATQYHPEYNSTIERPHPLFVRLAAAAAEFKRSRSVSRSPTVLLSPANTAHSQYAPDPPRTITI